MNDRVTDATWKGGFGNDYNVRNEGEGAIGRNVALLAKALAKVGGPIRNVIEFGCGTGQNLSALRHLLPPGLATAGIEINEDAAKLAETRFHHIWRGSAIDLDLGGAKADLILSKGFLIHVAPVDLPAIYGKLVEASNKFILIAEYYSRTPMAIEYRGELGLLWKRDFATEILGLYPALRVIDYGFVWRHDYPWQQDDLNWFLIEKR